MTSGDMRQKRVGGDTIRMFVIVLVVLMISV